MSDTMNLGGMLIYLFVSLIFLHAPHCDTLSSNRRVLHHLAEPNDYRVMMFASRPNSQSPTFIQGTTLQEKEQIRKRRLEHASKRRGETESERPNNDRLIRVLKGEKTDAIPAWAMRQAGRYLPEFRELRERHDFFEVCEDPKLAAEITIQPYRRYKANLDSVIIFSDILVVPRAMGMRVEMSPGRGPVFDWKLESEKDVERLNANVDVETELGYVFDAVYHTKSELHNAIPVIGFTGAPWTLLSYMIEGGGSKTWSEARKWLYEYPQTSKKLLAQLSHICSDYLVKQYDAGASVLQVFDTNAAILSPELFTEFSLPFLEEIAQAVKRQRPSSLLIGFPKGHAMYINKHETNFDGISVSWTEDLVKVAEHLAPKVAVQGNLDPAALYASDAVIRQKGSEMAKLMKRYRYVANLGHGMEPDMRPEALGAFFESIKSV